MKKVITILLSLFVSYNCLAQDNNPMNISISVGYGTFMYKSSNAEDYPNFLCHSIIVYGNFEKSYTNLSLSTSLRLGIKFPRESYYTRVNGYYQTTYSGLSPLIDESVSTNTKFYIEVPLGIRFHNSVLLKNIVFGSSFRHWGAKDPPDLLSSRNELVGFIQYSLPLGKSGSLLSLRFSQGLLPVFNWSTLNGNTNKLITSEMHTRFFQVDWSIPIQN